MLRSISAAPRSRFSFAASATTSGSQPASCTAIGCSSAAWEAIRNVLRAAWIIAFEAIISLTTRPTPQRLTRRRNGMSVTPDIGARITGLSSRIGPMMGSVLGGIADNSEIGPFWVPIY